MKDITRFCNISLSAGCANLDVVDLPEKCSMLHEPPFKIEETVATRRTLENVGIRLILMPTAGWLENEVLWMIIISLLKIEEFIPSFLTKHHYDKSPWL